MYSESPRCWLVVVVARSFAVAVAELLGLQAFWGALGDRDGCFPPSLRCASELPLRHDFDDFDDFAGDDAELHGNN